MLGCIICSQLHAQTVPILNYTINSFGQPVLEIDGNADSYYLLTARHEPNTNYESIVSMTLGEDGLMAISEPLAAYALENYKITEHSIASPDDTDGDGVDDITEYGNRPTQSPLNFAPAVPLVDGTTVITSQELYSELAVVSENIPWAPFLNNREFAKFVIVRQSSDEPEVYFINTKTHDIHNSFLSTIGLNVYLDDVETGEIVYNPNEILPNGAIGSYLFNYSFGNSVSFEKTQRTFELLAANMPFLNNNLKHFIGGGGENLYNTQYKDDFVGSRVDVVLESEFFADVNFLPFHEAEGFGLFKHMQAGDNPGSRDIVLYDALPNSLPRVGGIITSVVQTPLSHVNLRAIQDNVPNAYIAEPLMIDSISSLLGKYIYYKVSSDGYEIREASLEEVNEWFEKLRPTEPQIPERDLSFTKILPLDEIDFSMSTAFGAKCSNVATMRNFGFPEGTIPNGFGIPFYYYDEFMKFNGFYEEVEEMISDPNFINDLETRIDMLKDFRDDIKDADMPQWMLDDLDEMHKSFPEGTSVRTRSSTNNEDLPGFSGAGLYTSKTQHPDEGHMSKSIKQVYASMWNFRAYEERDFYRVDQYIAAMGVLCHPNYEDEKSNGVGVSIDPLYMTTGNYYINTQVGEVLITNPDANSIPEEILLSIDPDGGYFVLRESNLSPVGQNVMTDAHIDELRDYLTVIHDEFEILYNVEGAEGFGMDIEYKVTKEDQLIIKQARPWVSFWADINSNFDLSVEAIVEPISSSSLSEEEYVTASIKNAGLREMLNFDLSLFVDEDLVEEMSITESIGPQNSRDFQFTMPQDFSILGEHLLKVIVSHPEDGYEKNDTLETVINKLYPLEAELLDIHASPKCGNEVEIVALVKNIGEETFQSTELEVIVNGQLVEIVDYQFGIPYLSEVPISITITENLMQDNNEISINIIRVNGIKDAVSDNNSKSTTIGLDSEFDLITFVVKVDNYPYENTWALTDLNTGEVLESGDFSQGDFSKDICVNYSHCFELVVTDSYGDGICCGFGLGNFHVLNSQGIRIVDNDGNFGSIAEEQFCAVGCVVEADIDITLASSILATDGVITISPSLGIAPFSYSIDGGLNFSNSNIFENLEVGDYNVVVRDANFCQFEQTINLGFDTSSNTVDLLDNEIRLYPNPTEGTLYLELGINLKNNLSVDVYNSLGQEIKIQTVGQEIGDNTTVVSLDGYPAGTYVLRCYNKEVEQFFKVIKL